MRWLERTADAVARERHDITRPNWGVYLTRWVLSGGRFSPGPKVFLHLFRRGDAEGYCHDHPWPFTSVVLAGGYWEHTFDGRRRWYGPGRVLRRPADWRHWVEVPPGRTCWTLLFVGHKVRSWGFWCGNLFLPWRQHAANLAAGLPGCGD